MTRRSHTVLSLNMVVKISNKVIIIRICALWHVADSWWSQWLQQYCSTEQKQESLPQYKYLWVLAVIIYNKLWSEIILKNRNYVHSVYQSWLALSSSWPLQSHPQVSWWKWIRLHQCFLYCSESKVYIYTINYILLLYSWECYTLHNIYYLLRIIIRVHSCVIY